MQKTKLGISVGLAGAFAYFLAFIGYDSFWGMVAMVVFALYVLRFEENGWLKMTVIRAFMFVACFALLIAIIRLIPNVLSLIDDVANIFDEDVTVPWLSKTITAIVSLVTLAERVLLMVLTILSLKQSTIRLPVVDNLLAKYLQ